MFSTLHNHTEFSIGDATLKPEKLAQIAKLFGQPAFAITDHGTCSGLINGYNAAQKEGLKFIPGCEHYWTPDITIKDPKNRKLKHILFLAKDKTGYQNLLRLTSEAHRNFYYKPRLDIDIIRKYSEGLICTTACLGGVLDEHKALAEIFKDDFYLELHTNSLPEQRDFNRKALEIAEKFGYKFYPATDSHYATKKDAYIHRLWVGVGEEGDERYGTDDYFLHDEGDVRKALSYLGTDVVEAGLTTIDEVVAKCNVEIPMKGHNYPVFPVEKPREEIIKKVWAGCKDKGIANDQTHIDQIKHELDILEKSDYFNYFLICDSVIGWCRSQDIRVGIGRGSVVGSDVSFTMGFTGINPLEYNLIFERFCHLERRTPPDIDIDIPESRRAEVIDHIKEVFGAENVHQVRTFNYMADKAALKRAGQAIKIKHGAIDELSKGIETLDDLPKEFPEEWGKKWTVWDFEYADLIKCAKAFKSILQNYGVHASAVMIFPGEVEQWTALERGKDGQVVNFDFHDLEKMGLLKLDILGLATLDVINNTLKLVGHDIDMNHLPPADPKTMKLLCNGLTAGVFQLESDGMRHLTKQIQPQSVFDIVPIVALFRPGILRSGMLQQYIAGRKTGNFPSLHPKIDHIIKDTYGVIVYQEQIIKIVQELFGVSLGEADMVRRAVGRKEKEVLDEQIKILSEKGKANGIPEEESARILEIIAGFAEYGFNQSHAAAYAYTAYQTAYLKANYPREFMCAVLNNKLGDSEKTIFYMDEAKSMGIEVLPPSIYNSDLEWKLENGKLRMGLKAIKGVGQFDFVRPEPHQGLREFMAANPKVNKRIIDALIKAGCFSESRAWSMEYAAWFKEDAHRRSEIDFKIQKYTEEGKKGMVESWKKKFAELKPEPSHVDTTDAEMKAMEMEVLDFTFIDNLNEYDLELAARRPIDVIGGEVVRFKPHKTKAGKPMSFITVRDKMKKHDLVMFDAKTVREGGVYLFKLSRENVIRDFTEATKKKAA